MDRGAWPATVHQAIKSRTQLNDLTPFIALKNQGSVIQIK